MIVVGGVDAFYYGILDVQGDLGIIAGACVYLWDDGYATINGGGTGSVEGYLDLDYYAYLDVYRWPTARESTILSR